MYHLLVQSPLSMKLFTYIWKVPYHALFGNVEAFLNLDSPETESSTAITVWKLFVWALCISPLSRGVTPICTIFTALGQEVIFLLDCIAKTATDHWIHAHFALWPSGRLHTFRSLLLWQLILVDISKLETNLIFHTCKRTAVLWTFQFIQVLS